MLSQVHPLPLHVQIPRYLGDYNINPVSRPKSSSSSSYFAGISTIVSTSLSPSRPDSAGEYPDRAHHPPSPASPQENSSNFEIVGRSTPSFDSSLCQADSYENSDSPLRSSQSQHYPSVSGAPSSRSIINTPPSQRVLTRVSIIFQTLHLQLTCNNLIHQPPPLRKTVSPILAIRSIPGLIGQSVIQTQIQSVAVSRIWISTRQPKDQVLSSINEGCLSPPSSPTAIYIPTTRPPMQDPPADNPLHFSTPTTPSPHRPPCISAPSFIGGRALALFEIFGNNITSTHHPAVGGNTSLTVPTIRSIRWMSHCHLSSPLSLGDCLAPRAFLTPQRVVTSTAHPPRARALQPLLQGR